MKFYFHGIDQTGILFIDYQTAFLELGFYVRKTVGKVIDSYPRSCCHIVMRILSIMLFLKCFLLKMLNCLCFQLNVETVTVSLSFFDSLKIFKTP